jgi:transposase InsO family protein
MFLGEGHAKSVLHVVDTETNFSAATFLKDESSEEVWAAFLRFWADFYIGFHDIFRVDAGSAFTSRKFRALAESSGVILHYSGAESHNSIGAGETLHSSLRRIFNKLLADTPALIAT